MNRTTSIYLDLIRFLAALLVLLFHASYARFNGDWLNIFDQYGHEAVLVFFVLSGFVIAYISDTKETTLSIYLTNRLARLYSVVIPALILTLLLDYIGKGLDPIMYSGVQYQDSEPVYRFLANLLFINELWFESWRAFSNGPFWSLSYEFWYYVIFAACFYLTGVKRLFFALIAALIAGPKILLLFPIWIMGAFAYYLSKRITINKTKGLFLTLIPIGVLYLYLEYNLHYFLIHQTIQVLGDEFVYNDLNTSRRFLSDYVLGLLISIHFLGISALSQHFSFPRLLEKPIRHFAGMTFSTYLFHFPLLQFYGSFLNNGPAIFCMTFLSIILIAPYTEGKKREWAIALDKLYRLLSRALTMLTRPTN
jgi:peptidoglycan/LPS O-acetylase OafA/YrhL